MNPHSTEFVRGFSAAVLLRIEDLVGAGHPFEAAKRQALKEHSAQLKGAGPHNALAINLVVEGLRATDMSKLVVAARETWRLKQIEQQRGRPAGLFERALFKFSGFVF